MGISFQISHNLYLIKIRNNINNTSSSASGFFKAIKRVTESWIDSMLKTLPNNLRGHKMILTKTMTKKSTTFLAMFSIQQWNLELVVAHLVYFVMIITGVLFWTFVWCFAISSAAFPDLWHYITLLFTALAIIITFLFHLLP